jgi:hypothetical protein
MTAVTDVRARPAASIVGPKPEPEWTHLPEMMPLRKLLAEYHEVFWVIGTARKCGLEWRARYDDFAVRLERRHGPDMDRGAAVNNTIAAAMRRAAETATPDCGRAQGSLPYLRLPDVPPSLALAPGEPVPVRVRPRGTANDAFVAPDSRVVRSIYDTALPDDLFRLLLVRATLELAGHDYAAGAVERYLRGKVLAQLTGTEFRPAGRLDQVMDDQWATGSALDALRANLIASSLRPLRVASGDRSYLPEQAINGVTHESEGNAVWSSKHRGSGTLRWVHLFVEIENRGRNPIAHFDASVRVDSVAGGEPFMLGCEPAWRPPENRYDAARRRLATGERRLHICTGDVGSDTAAKWVSAVRAVARGATPLTLEVGAIDFAGAPLYVNGAGVSWKDEPRAMSEAVAAVRRADCSDRGSCAEDAEFAYKGDPRWPMLTMGLVAGAILGIIVHLFAWSWIKAGLISTGVGVAAGIGAVILLGKAHVFAAFVVGVLLVGVALPGFLVGLFSVLLALRGLGPRAG